MKSNDASGWPLAGAVTALVAAAAPALSCNSPLQAAESLAQPPLGEVWLTRDQLRESNIGVQPVAEQPLADAVVTGGRVALEDPLVGHVFSPVTGRVVRIEADLGAHVKRGQVLAVIESPDVGVAVSDMAKARADLIAAEHDFTRQRDLAAGHAAAQAVLEQSEDGWRRAVAEMGRARQKAALLHAGMLDTVSQTFAITSPVDGEILGRTINPGAEVQGEYAGGTSPELFTVGETRRVWVVGDLYEADVARVIVGAQADVTLLAYPGKVFHGKVDWISSTLDPGTRTARVRCTFDNADGLLRPEMFATLQLAVDPRHALAVPRESLLHLGEYRVVFRRVGETNGRTRFERVPVEVEDAVSGPWVEVRHGLEPGDEVVVGGSALLSRLL